VRKFSKTQDQATLQPVWMYRQEPAKRTSSLESDVWIPLLQALIISAAWMLLVGLALGLVIYWTSLPWWLVPLTTTGVGVVIFALQVTGFIRERRELLWKREETESRDLDGDNVIGKPEPVTLTVEVATKTNRGRQIQIVNLGIPPEKAVALARGTLNGRSFSEADWTGRGKPFSRREFKALRSTLVERGLVAWRNPSAPAQGVELTRVGRAVFERLAQGM